MSTVMEKKEAHRLIDRMPPEATWDDLIQEIYVRETIERGLVDSSQGRTKDITKVRAKYGLQVPPMKHGPRRSFHGDSS